MSKFKSLAEIKKVSAKLRRDGKKVVFTNGCFDIIHYGHVKYLEKCKKLGDVLIVGLNSDSSVRKIKGKGRPVTGQKERAVILAAMEFVDYVVLFDESTPAGLIAKIGPRVLVKGGDWAKSEIVGGAFVKKTGGRVVTVPFIKGYSTTRILKRLGGK